MEAQKAIVKFGTILDNAPHVVVGIRNDHVIVNVAGSNQKWTFEEVEKKIGK